ncbi:MAG: hypothetical protein Q9P01_09300 [Anaerolineae bacterium]|nr:hypothetical protein [Anaerolineae bacterium]
MLWLPWTLARVEDLRYPLVKGQKPSLFVKILQKYFDMLFLAASHDEYVGKTVLRVIQRTLPAFMLAHPAVVLRTIRAVLLKRNL